MGLVRKASQKMGFLLDGSTFANIIMAFNRILDFSNGLDFYPGFFVLCFRSSSALSMIFPWNMPYPVRCCLYVHRVYEFQVLTDELRERMTSSYPPLLKKGDGNWHSN